MTVADTVNSVLIVGDGVNISGAALTVGSGVVASAGGNATGNTLSVPTLAFGATEIVLSTYTGSTHSAPQSRQPDR